MNTLKSFVYTGCMHITEEAPLPLKKLAVEAGTYLIKRGGSFWYSEKLELEFVVPNHEDSNDNKKILIYLHDEAYVYCSNNTHHQLYCRLTLNYILTLEHPFPCALEDTLAVYFYLINQNTEEHLEMDINVTAGGLLLNSWNDFNSSPPIMMLKKFIRINGSILYRYSNSFILILVTIHSNP
ncbi:hypothetical protein K502DRAFT_368401 [Neoconidiobolus thromboides FSU 785]|nr:hypothetical protein K502DRAFT_368401 [Neoconidiobolus thromboides FSU 785]